ncbi:hypothetical protein CHS0354_027624 [Potamilus streckersoni]|uniref:CABIT domain-containing protein n=1 Tax=Potamilus streckersoni TaxID=2493646 RepID=A0AAE0T0R0_9BIVA|nr:hypothetical protein CHS0354_027624 [Potamilus streckersoni]
MAASSDGVKNAGNMCSLAEFVEIYDLPQWVSVLGGSELSTSKNIRKGDILLIHTLAVETIALSYTDPDTNQIRTLDVPADANVRFQILPPESKKDGKFAVFTCVKDLLKVCPTYFKVNSVDESPNLPETFKPGEIFRFIKRSRRADNKQVYLQCEDASGNILELPFDCRGNFTVVPDDRLFTIKEILQLGAVPRSLKLSSVQLQLGSQGASEAAIYGNLLTPDGSDIFHRIMGIPLTYSGILTLHQPKLFLVVSSQENMDMKQKLPLEADIIVRSYSSDDYEAPGGNSLREMLTLEEVMNRFGDDLPMLATVIHYKNIPSEFRAYLPPGQDVIIHKIEKADRLLAESRNVYFSIAKTLKGHFRDTLKSMYSMKEMAELGTHKDVKVLQDVASDYPKPFSLQAGDVIRLKSQELIEYKMKRGRKTFGAFDVYKCEKRISEKKYEKLLLPKDLEICMHEIPSKEKESGFPASDVFRLEITLPRSVDFLADYTTLWTCLPINSEITLNRFVSEKFVVISPVQKDDKSGRCCIDAKLEACLLVPLRHHLVLAVKNHLGFPPEYFQFPDRNEYVTLDAERIEKKTYDSLIRHSDNEYEDYEATGSDSGVDEAVVTRRNKPFYDNTQTGLNKRFSRSLGTLFNKGKKMSGLFDRTPKIKETPPKETTPKAAVVNQTYNVSLQSSSGMEDEEYFEEECIYEKYEVPSRKEK